MVFVAAGLVAFAKLNIEAYPNPAPVILEITAQAAGLSAEEMERYYTVPMEIGLYPTPGIDNIRSTSFYGLTFVRVTFKYGVDYFFAYHPGGIEPAAERDSARQPGRQQFAIEPRRRDLSLPGGRPAAFRAHQSANRAGLDRTARLVYRSAALCR